jgi:hypothetical protein
MNLHAFRYPTLTFEHPAERVVLRVLIAAIILFALAYVYLIAASTFNIIARKQAEVSAISTQSSLAMINSEYYQLSGEVTPQHALAIGLTPVSQKDYVTRTSRLGYAGPASR